MMCVYPIRDSSAGVAPAMPEFRLSAMTTYLHQKLLTLHHRHSDARDTNELVIFVANLNAPNLAAPTDVIRTRRRGYESRGHRAHVVSIDFLSHAHRLLCIHTEVGRE